MYKSVYSRSVFGYIIYVVVCCMGYSFYLILNSICSQQLEEGNYWVLCVKSKNGQQTPIQHWFIPLYQVQRTAVLKATSQFFLVFGWQRSCYVVLTLLSRRFQINIMELAGGNCDISLFPLPCFFKYFILTVYNRSNHINK